MSMRLLILTIASSDPDERILYLNPAHIVSIRIDPGTQITRVKLATGETHWVVESAVEIATTLTGDGVGLLSARED